ncbi:MAG: efflux RND transporter periplasmic adaptor subunit [Halanaerobiales bacterium]|nr:efflux RND transporter periplasmic adaptor subunit [Halanaerobiales bacterium]
MKKILVIIIVILLVITGIYYGYNRFYASLDTEENQQIITDQNTIEVSEGSMKKTISASGNIYPVKDRSLTFSTNGTIDSLNIEEGDKVVRDYILIELKNNQAKLQFLRAENQYKNAQINGSPNAIKEAELDYKIARENLEDTRLKAPYTGVITELLVQEGDYINSGQQVATLIDNSQYEVSANIDESELSSLEVGQNVEINMEALPGLELKGKLTEISSKAVNNSGVVTISITVLIDSVYDSFKPGLSADIEIIVGQVKDKIIIPVTALINRNGKKVVLRVNEDSTKPVEVKTGLTDGIRIVIVSGLKIGDKIIVNSSVMANPGEVQRQFPQGMIGGGPGRSGGN